MSVAHGRQDATATQPAPGDWGRTYAQRCEPRGSEGATRAGGRGPSIWDTFAKVPVAIARGESGYPACDHFHRWRDDIKLMVDLGITSYRFSIAWPRIQSIRKGSPNPAGLAFYDRLVDELLATGIRPFPTQRRHNLGAIWVVLR